MRRGTTPTISLEFDDDLRGYTLYFTMKGTGTQLTKTNKDMIVRFVPEIAKTLVYIPLSQSDTLTFRGGSSVRCQMRVVKDDYADASDIYTIPVEDTLLDGAVYDLCRED